MSVSGLRRRLLRAAGRGARRVRASRGARAFRAPGRSSRLRSAIRAKLLGLPRSRGTIRACTAAQRSIVPGNHFRRRVHAGRFRGARIDLDACLRPASRAARSPTSRSRSWCAASVQNGKSLTSPPLVRCPTIWRPPTRATCTRRKIVRPAPASVWPGMRQLPRSAWPGGKQAGRVARSGVFIARQ